MASTKAFVDFVSEQLNKAGAINCKSMFGEYGVYLEGKFFAVICDDKFFLKPTEAGRLFIDNPVEAPPYPGAKNYFLIEDQIEDRDWLCELARLTADNLPAARPKASKRKKKQK